MIGLSEQHPREQGLKRIACTSCTPPGAPFQSNIQENKDWNTARAPRLPARPDFQSNIQENKDWNRKRWATNDTDQTFRATSKRTRIETSSASRIWMNFSPAFRATSKRTRIETARRAGRPVPDRSFQSNIQENKDWNCQDGYTTAWTIHTFRATSKRTRIETTYVVLVLWHSGSTFRATSKRTRIETRRRYLSIWYFRLSEQHPREQGLKHMITGIDVPVEIKTFRATSKRTRIETTICTIYPTCYPSFRATSKRTRIETTYVVLVLWHSGSTFRATSKRTRIETRRRYLSIWYFRLSEQHPREQGLKHMITGIDVPVEIKTFRATSKRTRIETTICTIYPTCYPSFRATSKRTRIETASSASITRTNKSDFQSNIQENKDWN